MARINKKRVKDALHKYKGAAYLAAKHINCTPKTIYNYINKYDDLREIKEDYDEEVNDIAELGLRESVIAKREWAIKYQLSTKGKSRGYVERQETDFAIKGDKTIFVVGHGIEDAKDND